MKIGGMEFENAREAFHYWFVGHVIQRDGKCDLSAILIDALEPINPVLAARGREVYVPRCDNYVGLLDALEIESQWQDEAMDYLLANRPLMLEGAIA